MGRTTRLISAYEKNELFELWLRFRNDRDAETMLSDFMGGTKDQARELIKDFEVEYLKNTLDACGLS